MPQPLCDAMILCAGLGTRLRPLTLERPKPAVPLMHRPLVGCTLALLRAAGFESVLVNTHWLPEQMAQLAREEARALGMELRVSHEPQILGTGGALRRARDAGLVARDRPLLVLNGDVLFDVDLARALRVHEESQAAATMVLLPLPPGGGYNPVEADAQGRIHRVAAEGAPSDPTRGKYLFTGVHVLGPEAIDLVPAGEQGVVQTAYRDLLARGRRVQACFETGAWLDLGDAPGYLAAHLHVLSGRLRVPRLVAAGALPEPPQPVHPSAQVAADARLDRTVVGPQATVGARARLVECVLWEGARVEADEVLERTIVTPTMRVAVPG